MARGVSAAARPHAARRIANVLAIVTTLAIVILATPAELVAERSGEQITLHWKPSPGALRFEVQRSDDFNPWRRLGEVIAPVADFSEKSPDAKRSTYRVRATNANGASPWSNPAWAGQ